MQVVFSQEWMQQMRNLRFDQRANVSEFFKKCHMCCSINQKQASFQSFGHSKGLIFPD